MSTDLPDPSTSEPVGEQLRQARLLHNRTLEDAAAQTRISISILRAIEASTFDQLPADAFAKGLVLLYATYLGFDGQTMAQKFLHERGSGRKNNLSPLQKRQRSHALEPKKLAEQTRISSATVATVLFICIVVSFTGFCLHYSWNPFAYLTDKALSFTSTVKNTFPPADPANSGLRTQNTLELQAVFHTDCRVLVVIDEQQASEQTYLKGSTIQWEAQRSMQIDFLQENCAELQLNGSLLAAPVFSDGRAVLRLPLTAHGP
jgi:hypothetical protein